MTPPKDPIATLSPSPARRGLAIGTFWVLAGLLAALALTAEGLTLGARGAFLIGAGLAFAMGARLRSATRVSLVLTDTTMETSAGEVLFRLDDIDHLDRGLFAFKPPNGFSVVVKNKGPGAWQPGLYWRMGRRYGLGGVTAPAEGKFMAEMLAQKLAGLNP